MVGACSLACMNLQVSTVLTWKLGLTYANIWVHTQVQVSFFIRRTRSLWFARFGRGCWTVCARRRGGGQYSLVVSVSKNDVTETYIPNRTDAGLRRQGPVLLIMQCHMASSASSLEPFRAALYTLVLFRFHMMLNNGHISLWVPYCHLRSQHDPEGG